MMRDCPWFLLDDDIRQSKEQIFVNLVRYRSMPFLGSRWSDYMVLFFIVKGASDS